MNDTRGDRHVQSKLQACRDGELPAAQAVAVREHLAGCPECRDAWSALEATWSAVTAAGLPEPPRPAWPGLRARLSPPRRARLPLAAGLAAALTGLLGGLLVGSPGRAGALVTTAGADTTSEWTGTQTLVAEGVATTLDGIYLATAAGDLAAGNAGAEEKR